MKVNTFVPVLLAGLLGLIGWACNTVDPDTSFDPASPGILRLTFDNVAGGQDLQLNTGTYRNATGESFTPTTFNYFVSNVTTPLACRTSPNLIRLCVRIANLVSR